MPTSDRRTTRPRRGSILDAVPEQLGAWFRGEIPDTLYRLLPHEDTMLGVRWRAFSRENPGARPPDGYAWLDDSHSPKQPTQAQIAEARRMLMRDLVP